MKQLLVICGPTAVGKTSLALSLAKSINGELVNADARQVYRGMDIGTGKDLPANSKHKIRNSKSSIKKIDNFRVGYYSFGNIPIWLLDIVDPNYRFTVANYLQCVPPVLNNIWQRNRLPIIVGGSGFYLRALLEGIGTIGVKPDWALRKKLACQTVIDLQTMLKKQDELHYNRMNHSDKNNPRRLIRAIEIAHKIKSKTAKNGWQGIEKELKIDKKIFLRGATYTGKLSKGSAYSGVLARNLDKLSLSNLNYVGTIARGGVKTVGAAYSYGLPTYYGATLLGEYKATAPELRDKNLKILEQV